MKRHLSITVRGNQRQWSFKFDGDPKYLAEWREDGLEVDEVYNSIPEWLPSWLMRPWCAIQDVFHFRNPMGRA